MKKLNRRQFLQTGTTTLGACACCSSALLASSSNNYAWAANPGGPDSMLILLNQAGGNDHLNNFAIPYSVTAYYNIRPTIAIDSASVLQTSAGVGFHPLLSNLHRLYQSGNVAVIQSCGEPSGSRSHAAASDIWSRGSTNSSENTGWIGRLVSLHMNAIPFNTLGIGIGTRLDFNGNATQNQPIVLPSLNSWNIDVLPGSDSAYRDQAYRAQIAQTLLHNSRNSRERAVVDSTNSMFQAMKQIRNVSQQTITGSYPSATPGRYFQDAARLAAYGLGTKITYGVIGGWDTHSNELSGQSGKLTAFDQSLAALETDLKAAGKWNSSTIALFSEFGRTTKENASGGTDHGNGGAMLLIGGSVRGGVYGPTPTNADIQDERWIHPQIDFRNVLSEMVAWLGFDPNDIFTETYSRVNLGLFA